MNFGYKPEGMTEKMILITRPHLQATQTGEKLVKMGYKPLYAPLLTITPCLDALPQTAPQAVIITSSNALFALEPLPRTTPLFVVGSATAAKARQMGFTQCHHGTGDSADLCPLITHHCTPSPAPLLYLTGDRVAGDLAPQLRQHGFMVVQHKVYDATPATALPPAVLEALEQERVSVVLLYSPRTAALWARLCPEAAKQRLTLLALSSAIAAAAGHGFKEILYTDTPSEQKLLETLAQIAPSCEKEPSPTNAKDAPS